MARLNDTRAVVAIPYREGCLGPLERSEGGRVSSRANPNAGEACTFRREQPEAYDCSRPETSAGSESLRGAVMFLGKRITRDEG
jgi:hypothetical protein